MPGTRRWPAESGGEEKQEIMRLMSNVAKENKGLILQAAKDTKYRVQVADTAYVPSTSHVLEGYIGVFSVDNIDSKAFWRRYEELREAVQFPAQTYAGEVEK